MKTLRWLVLALIVVLGPWAAQAQAWGRVGISVGIGFPLFPGPCWGCGYYYRPYPVYVAPAPIYVAPAPVVVQPAPVVRPVYSAPTPQTDDLPPAPVPETAVQPAVASAPASSRQLDIRQYLQLLADPNERVRLDTVGQLGRMKAQRAIDPLAATLAGDRSPAVREAAARALGIIGSPRGLPALTRAAQADPDHDVRRSAQFAVEVIQSR